MSGTSSRQITQALSAGIEYLEVFATSALSTLVVRDMKSAIGYATTTNVFAESQDEKKRKHRQRVLGALRSAIDYIEQREQSPPLRDLVLAELRLALEAMTQ